MSQEEALTSQLTSSHCKCSQRLGAYFTQSANPKIENEPHPNPGHIPAIVTFGGVFNLPGPQFLICTMELVMRATWKVHQAASSTQEVVILAGVTMGMVMPFLPGTPVAMAMA